MAQSDDAVTRSSGDPTLEGALAEMASEGFDPSAEMGAVDPGAVSAAPAVPDASAAKPSEAKPDAPVPTGEPASSAPVAPTEADPLEGTTAFTYGSGKTLQGVYAAPEGGLLIPKGSEHVLTQLAEQRDTYASALAQSRESEAQAARYTAWKTTGADGTETTLSGQQAVEARDVLIARQEAIIAQMDAMLNDPRRLVELLEAGEQPGTVVLSEQGLEMLQLRAERAAASADAAARTRFQQATAAPAPEAPDVAKMVRDNAPNVIKRAAQEVGLDSAVLTKADETEFTDLLGRFLRRATAEDLRDNPARKLGQIIVDGAFTTVVKNRIELRQEAVKREQTAAQAAKHNAGMDKGRAPAKAPAKAPVAAKPEKQPETRKKADWDSPFQDALKELNIA